MHDDTFHRLTLVLLQPRVRTMHAKAQRAFLHAIITWLIIAPNAGSVLNAADSGSKTEGGLLLIANKGDRTLGVIDPAAGRQIATVPEDGVTGHEVVASPDGKRAFVPI